MKMKKQDLKELRKALPRGSRYLEINQKLKQKELKEYSHDYIRNVLLGKSPNNEIIIAAIEVAKEHKDRLEKAMKEFKGE